MEKQRNRIGNFKNSSNMEEVFDAMDDNIDKHLALSGIYDEALEKTR